MMRLRILLLIMAALILYTGCKDKEMTDRPRPGDWKAVVLGGSAAERSEEGTVVFGQRAVYGSLRIELTGYNASRDGMVAVSCSDASWLTVDSKTMGEDGIISLTVQDNDDDVRRYATITFSSTLYPSVTASVKAEQLSKADNDINGDEAKEQLYVGYGYDIYKALDNPMAVRTRKPIINYDHLVKAGTSASYETVHDSHLSRTEMLYVASRSLYEYAEDLTNQQTKSAEYTVPGCKADCDLAVGLGDGAETEMQNYGRGIMLKTVHARVIDKAALQHLKSQGRMPYSTDFLNRILAVQQAKGSKRRSLVEQTLEEFGTHLIIQADLGGRIDYTFTMQKSGTVYSQDEMVEEAEYTMGRISADDRNKTYNQETSSSKSASGAIKVVGGSQSVRNNLKNDIKGLSKSGQLSPDHITEWLASINYTEDAYRSGAIDVVHFELEPLWNLVPDNIRDIFMEVTLDMVQRSDCGPTDDLLGTDLYTIDCTKSDLFDFRNTGDDQSLCRILYLRSGEDKTLTPVLQVCSEYVPYIRTDQRVTVIYPIYKQKIRLNEGLFIGDGVHQPAYVGFGGSECFVAPITTMKSSDVIRLVSYINGSLSIDQPGVKFISEDNRGRTVKDDLFYFRSGSTTYEYPIVKIGSQFWTRKDVGFKMGLATSSSSDRTLDVLRDNILYARFWHDLGRTTAGTNKWMWANEPNTLFKGNPNMKWYFPTGDDVKKLYAYLGFNPKALFSGQVSGFNAQFSGYYGGYDIVNKKSTDQVIVRYKGELNVFSTRNTKDQSNAVLLVLDKNYQLYEAANGPDGTWRENYYPVRPVRGYMFNYPTLNTIQDFEKKYK